MCFKVRIWHSASFWNPAREKENRSWSESDSLEMAGGLPSNFLRIQKKKIRIFTEPFLPRAWQTGFDYTPFFFPLMLFLLSPVGAATALNQSSHSRTGHIWAIKYPDWSWLGYQVMGRLPRMTTWWVYLASEMEMLFPSSVGWHINENASDGCVCCRGGKRKRSPLKDKAQFDFFASPFKKGKQVNYASTRQCGNLPSIWF